MVSLYPLANGGLAYAGLDHVLFDLVKEYNEVKLQKFCCNVFHLTGYLFKPYVLFKRACLRS